MLAVRREQFAVLGEHMRARFEAQMVGYLRHAQAEATQDMADEELRALVHSGVVRAQSYGVKIDFDIQRFLEYEVQNGAPFERALVWAREILDDPGLRGSEKMDRVDDRMIFGVRKAKSSEGPRLGGDTG